MKKAIASKHSKSVTVIERADWSIKFYDPETGRHYTRRVWYPTSGIDIYVQHRGGFYSILTEFGGKYDPQAISRHEAVSADELETMTAEIIAHRTGKQYADELTWEEVTRIYAYAIICRDADEYATMSAVVSDILQDSSKQPAQQATETAEQNAAELAERAEIIAAIEDDHQRDYIEAEATAHQWTPDETRAAIEYRAAITAANRAALALLDAYAEITGKPAYDMDAAAVHRVARDEITGTSARATESDRAAVAAMIEAIAAAAEPEPEPRTARHYYAECSPYGVSTLSDGDTLARFDSREEREQWCSIDPEHRAPVTLAEVRHRYDVRLFAANQETPANIHHRPSYQL